MKPQLQVFYLVYGEVDFSITEIGSEREKVNETPCKREIEVFYVVFTEDLLVFKLAQREPVKSPRTFLATIAACSCAIISH